GTHTAIFGAAVDYSVPGPGPNPNYQDIIVVGRTTPSGTTTPQIAIARLHAQDGTPNPVFSGDGKLVMPFSPGFVDSEASGVVIQHTGKIVVAAMVEPDASTGFDFGAPRFNLDGPLASTFGPSSDGRSRIASGTSA